jgi:hypothetical protein
MEIFWGYSNYIKSDLTPRKESIMSADHDREVLLARTVDTHTCTHNVALGASGIHPTLYVEQPRLLAVLTYWTGNRHHRVVDSDSIRQQIPNHYGSVFIGSQHARVYRFNLFPKHHHHLDYYVFQTVCTLVELSNQNMPCISYNQAIPWYKNPQSVAINNRSRLWNAKIYQNKNISGFYPQLVQSRSNFRQFPLNPNQNRLPMCPKVIFFN